MNRLLLAKHAEDRAPLRSAARRHAGFVARSSRTAPGTHRRSRLASGPGGLQQNANLFLREPLVAGSDSQPLLRQAADQVDDQRRGRLCMGRARGLLIAIEVSDSCHESSRR
jgi:hypothetical protein